VKRISGVFYWGRLGEEEGREKEGGGGVGGGEVEAKDGR